MNKKDEGVQETPLQMATIYSQLEVVKALLERGARLDLADWKGDSPVPTAKQKCEHDGKGNEPCCQVLNMLLEADKSRKEDSSIQKEADSLREKGNKAFKQGDFEKARDFYSHSIEVMEEYRAYANRSLCNLEIGKSILKHEWENKGCYKRAIARWGEEAMSDASKAATMNPTFAKAYYRMALGHSMARDFPRARCDVEEGLKHCPGNGALELLLQELIALGVPNHFSNPYSDAARNAIQKVDSGAPSILCVYCRSRIPLPLEDKCPLCTVEINDNVQEKDIIDFILSH